MKKIFLLLTIITMVFTSCEPLEDINTEIDAQDNPIIGDTEYTLTDDDYDALDLDFGSFSSEDDAKAMIPGLLTDMFPVWGNGSSVLTGYNLYIGNADGVRDYTGADDYQLATLDYPNGNLNAVAFYPSENPEDFMNDILSAEFTSPTEGQLVLAKYKQYIEEPIVGFANVYGATFPGDFTNFEIKDEGASDVDVWSEGSSYAQGSGYNGFTSGNIEWFISPEIDLAGQINLKFQINQYMKYVNGNWGLLKLLVSKDFTTGGDQLAATWDAIDIQTLPAGDGNEYVLSEDYDLSAYDGETIHIAFSLESTLADAPRWRIESFNIKAPGVTGETTRMEAFYTYSGGTWELAEGVYFLSDADFDSMGEGSGQPGKYNNFGSSTPPNNYLPVFMANKFPYGQEDEELFIIYDYFSSSSGAQLRGNLYTVIDGVWTGHESTIATTLQFGHDGNTWVPDNTIKYTLIRNDDYEYMASQLTDPEFAGLIGNLAKYGDFDYNWTDTQIQYALTLFLDNHDPSAANGQKYLLTYVIYDNGEGEYSTKFEKKDSVWVLFE